jgi:peptidoglycan/xylan/chitin deacetylase (PgdA/CDA1 family)
MKVIISHDVDSITAWEHKKDLGIPKFIVRSSIELVIGKISFTEYLLRFEELAKNKFQNLEELMRFDKENKVPSIFFVGVNNGLGLSYSLKNAEYWVKKIVEKGFDIGVHGIEFDNFDGINREYEIFKNLSGLKKFGIRMHYLRNTKDTLKFLNEAGYIFDSTLYKLENPFKIGDLWEFPLHIMDSYTFHQNSRWQNQTLEEAKGTAKAKIDRAYSNRIKYFTILFHDRYFSDSFKSWKDWYIWMIGYLKSCGFEFTTYREAIQELEEKA